VFGKPLPGNRSGIILYKLYTNPIISFINPNKKSEIMKKLFNFIAILALITGLNVRLSAQPQYYNFNSAGTGNSFPFMMAAGKMVQTLHLPGEFSNPAPAPSGQITSVFVRLFLAMNNKPYTDLTIKMGQTTLTDLTAGTFYSGLMTTVYYRSSITINNPADWLEFLLDTPFPYDPTQSLVIELSQCQTDNYTGGQVRYTITSGIKRVASSGGCPYTPGPSANAYVTHTGINVGTVSGPPIVVTQAATAVTSTTATLNGTVNANGANTTVSFEYGLTTAYGTTVPGVPALVTGTTVTPVLANITGLLPGNTYHFRVNGVNSNGTTNGNDMTFNTPPILPTVVTTTATGVGSTTATLNGTVNAGGASTTVTFDYGLTIAYGTTVPGVPGTVTGNTVTPVSANISGLTLNTTYHYRVNGVNSVGTVNGADMTFTTTSCPMPGAPGTITGPAIVCGNSTGNVYAVAPIVNATGYTWSVPAGAVITAGANTNSITVTMGNSAGTVSVYGTNTCGNGSASNLTVTVTTAPVPTITGQSTMCVNSGYYYYSTQSGQNNYIWTISTGGTITYGAGTSQVQVTWNNSGAQSISVNYTNAAGCSAGTPTVLPVTVNPYPGNAGNITGTATVCGGTNAVAYSVPPVQNAAVYVWTLPPGATIAAGGGTNSITVDFGPGATSGNITVFGNNLCGNGNASPPFAVTVTPLPGAAGTITGDASVCQGESGVAYSVAAVANAQSYTWTVPPGAAIATGSGTNSITVDFSSSASSGSITVNATNQCGSGAASPNFDVSVNPVPATPVITASSDTLMSSEPSGNQWFFEGNMIPGATGQMYVATQSGEYWSVVTLNGCSSAESNHFFLIIAGSGQLSAFSFQLYPVPNDGLFNVTVSGDLNGPYDIIVFNMLGIKMAEIRNVDGSEGKLVDVRGISPGLYTIVLKSNSSSFIRKVLIR
jgi:hypothetical protein